ncbi:hypothetical protein DFR29_101106 [Tahibacter aquaticus]|uniref:Uncharacterized protein n=1 Tax=Tahibacter aquaticus TaxID=520092 RepID=A0A4V6PYH9_9GAMM|nr:hypothetical protein DFR29_101106 [Tahibacter aquaticus]
MLEFGIAVPFLHRPFAGKSLFSWRSQRQLSEHAPQRL